MNKKNVVIAALLALSLFVAACSAGASDEPVLAVSGVAEASFTQAQLEAFDKVPAEYEQKDGTVSEYSGPMIAEILSAAKASGYSTLTIVAADGYEAEVTSDELVACMDCILAYDSEDGWSAVMPGFSGKLQVKSVVELKAQ